MLIANIFYIVCLLANHATMKEQGFLSFARSRVIIVRFYREKKIKCKKLANN